MAFVSLPPTSGSVFLQSLVLSVKDPALLIRTSSDSERIETGLSKTEGFGLRAGVVDDQPGSDI
jgi:hypothetical protein